MTDQIARRENEKHHNQLVHAHIFSSKSVTVIVKNSCLKHGVISQV